jgi:transposase
MSIKTISEQTDKDYLKQNVGIDVGRDDLKVCLSVLTRKFEMETHVQQVYTNDKKGWVTLSAWLGKQLKPGEEPLHCTMEATGVYYENLAHYLHGQNYKVHVVLANHSKSYGRSLGIKSKTDKIDARTLSKMGLERTLREWTPPGTVLIKLKQMIRERERFVNIRTVLKNSLHSCEYRAFPHASTADRTNGAISFIKGQIRLINGEIASVMQTDEEIKRKLPYLLSIPGVGVLTAATVISETRGFAGTVNCRQIAGYCGLDVQIAESGTWKGQSRISKKGNSHLRHALYMSALSKIRFDASTKEHYEKLKGRTCPMKALTAECRKLICLMYTLWKKEEMYCPDYKNGGNDVAETVKNDKSSSVNPEPEDISPVSVEELKNEDGDLAGTVKKCPVRRTSSSEKTASEDKNEDSDAVKTVLKDSAPYPKSGSKKCVKHIKNKNDVK